MDRRTFFHTSIVSTLAAKVLSGGPLARAQTPTEPSPTPRRLTLDCYTRNLHWLRSPDEIAEAAIEMTCGGVMPTVQPYPGHVNPDNVAQELPEFVRAMERHGLPVRQVRGWGATDVSSPNLETMLGTMGQLGVTYYWMGTDNYDLSQPILPQLDAIKLKVEEFVRLNERHGTTLMYHTRAGASSVGNVVWDLLYVLKDFDPAHVGIHWDTGHMSHHGAMWETLMRTAGPYVVAMGWKDRTWRQDLGRLQEQGGPFEPEPEPEAGGGGGGRGGGGRGGGGPRSVPLPLAGERFARGGGWTSPQTPMGTGLVNIFRYAEVMRDIGFDGPMELQAEYPNGGAERGRDTITLPPVRVIGNMKRDVLTMRAALAEGAGLII